VAVTELVLEMFFQSIRPERAKDNKAGQRPVVVKKMPKFYIALSGLWQRVEMFFSQRALPFAIIFCPFRALEMKYSKTTKP
jgi:hypothetical protein